MFALAGLLIIPWLVVATIYTRGAAASAPEPAAAAPKSPGTPGPWGKLVTTPILVSPPLEYIAIEEAPATALRWSFPGVTPDVLASFLASTGMSSEDARSLQAAAQTAPDINGLVIAPDPALVRRLAPEVRGRLYIQLGKTRLNRAQAHAYRFLGASVEEWLSGSPISAETRALVTPLFYRDGNVFYFADYELVQSLIPSVDERRRLVKTLVRSTTLMVNLAVDDPSQVDAIAEYWGRGGRRIDIRPLLESIAASPGRSIDVTHLLPSLARNHLYRYPKLTVADFERPVLANCLWSALNFFSQEPDDRFLDVERSLTTLRDQYTMIEDGFQLGDVIVFVDANGAPFHAAVYLADGLAFSKNGTSQMTPWVIMSVENIKGFYRTREPSPRLIYHRRSDM